MRSKLSISSSTRGGESAARWGNVLLPHPGSPPHVSRPRHRKSRCHTERQRPYVSAGLEFMDTIHARVAVFTNSSPFSKKLDFSRRFKLRLAVTLLQNSVSSAHFFIDRPRPCANSREACARRSLGVMPSKWSISLPGIAFSSPCGKMSKIFTVCPSILAFVVVKWRAGRALQFFPALSCSVCW